MCDDKSKIDKLITELDNFFSNGGSHMNVEFNSEYNTKIITTNYNECCEGKNACGIPTEFFDEEDV